MEALDLTVRLQRDPSGLHVLTSEDLPGLFVVHGELSGALTMLPGALIQLRAAQAELQTR